MLKVYQIQSHLMQQKPALQAKRLRCLVHGLHKQVGYHLLRQRLLHQQTCRLCLQLSHLRRMQQSYEPDQFALQDRLTHLLVDTLIHLLYPHTQPCQYAIRLASYHQILKTLHQFLERRQTSLSKQLSQLQLMFFS